MIASATATPRRGRGRARGGAGGYRGLGVGPIVSFSHVYRSDRVWASGGEGAGRETANLVFTRSVPASGFA